MFPSEESIRSTTSKQMPQDAWLGGIPGEDMQGGMEDGHGFTMGNGGLKLEHPHSPTGLTENRAKKFRRSCDRCTAKKIKCDGMAQCENCVKRGYQCHYSARRRTGPRVKTAHEEHPEWATAANGGLVPWLGGDGRSPTSTLVAGGVPRATIGGFAPAAAAGRHYGAEAAFNSTPPFVPNVLSQQPPSQLIGREESQFLDYFLRDYNSFMPIADEPVVRSALMQLMSGGHLPVATNRLQSKALQPDTTLSIEQVQLANSHNAILWGGIAIGALMAGVSNDNVNGYASLAWLSMKECFDYECPSVVSAYLVISVLFLFLGEISRHRRYLGLADQLHKELGGPSEELKRAILFMKIGQCADLGMPYETFRFIAQQELPERPLLRAIALLNKVRATLIYHKHENEQRRAKDQPRCEYDITEMINEVLAADRILSEVPTIANSAYYASYLRGLLGVLTHWKTRDARQAISYMKPLMDAVDRMPGICKIMPCWHFVHALGMYMHVLGDAKGYRRMQQLQANITRDNVTRDAHTPLPDVTESLEDELASFCTHPVCSHVWGLVSGKAAWNELMAPQCGSSSSSSSTSSLSSAPQPGSPFVPGSAGLHPQVSDKDLQSFDFFDLELLDSLATGSLDELAELDPEGAVPIVL